MPDHASIVVILAEDQEHQNLVWHYLRNCAQYRKKMGRVRKLPLPASRGCGSQYVREQFSVQVKACRARQANNLLIVITDADNLSTREREHTLQDELALNKLKAIDALEPVVILIPKWQVETWIKCLHGQKMSEDDPTSDRPAATAEQIVSAATTHCMPGQDPTRIAALHVSIHCDPHWPAG